MSKFALGFIIAVATLCGQTAETHFFLADLRAANEVPAVVNPSYGSAVLYVHFLKDPQGKVVSGTVDFNITGQFNDAYTVTGLHIHSGVAGVNGPVTVDSGITAANSLAVTAGRTLIQRPGQARTDAAVATLEGLLANPAAYYVNLHTSVNPGGMIRGQLYRAQRRTFMTSMSGANEVPPVEGAFSGIGTFHGFRAFDNEGRYVTGGGLFIVNYNLAPVTTGGTNAPQRLTGLHIHRGPAGVNGPVVLDSALTAALAIDTPGNGVGGVTFLMAAPNDTPAAVLALNDLWDSPAAFYMNLHTAASPGGIVRGQMRIAESVTMSVNMSPANEVPPITGLDATGASVIQVDLVRNAAGAATQAMVLFSVNHRFPERPPSPASTSTKAPPPSTDRSASTAPSPRPTMSLRPTASVTFSASSTPAPTRPSPP